MDQGGRRINRVGFLAPFIWAAGSLALWNDARAGSARDYLNAPVDLWLAIYNASYTSAVTPEDGDDLVPGVRSNVFAQSLVLTRIMDYWGRTGGVSIVLPYAFLDATAGPFRASANGASDIGFLWQMNIFGGPALTRAEFQSFIPQTFSSFHLLVTTPLGTYDPTSSINPSANRWMVSPTVNFSYTPDEGWTWVETYVSGRFFTNNDNYRVGGAQTLSQRPILRLEGHVSRNMTDALWLSLDAFYNVGGETSIDGLGQDNKANTLRVGAGMGLRLWRGADLGLNYERVVAKPAGEPDFADRALNLQAIVVRHAGWIAAGDRARRLHSGWPRAAASGKRAAPGAARRLEGGSCDVGGRDGHSGGQDRDAEKARRRARVFLRGL